MHTLIATLIVMTALLELPAPVASQRGAPDRVVEDVNYGPPPESLKALYADSDTVVHVRIENSHVRVTGTTARDPSVVTDHRSAVVAVFKDSHKAIRGNGVIHVLQHAGSLRIQGTLRVSDPGRMPVLTEGEEAIVFLTRQPAAGGYRIVSGPAGLFVVTNGKIQLSREARAFPELAGRTEITLDDLTGLLGTLSGEDE